MLKNIVKEGSYKNIDNHLSGKKVLSPEELVPEVAFFSGAIFATNELGKINELFTLLEKEAPNLVRYLLNIGQGNLAFGATNLEDYVRAGLLENGGVSDYDS